ncbi:hypothetical protein NDA14_004101 [Ustilago hordei]|uniref:Uncharacterized protein n=1 Tax=Ustilago hordei TaxID=120017 RepID=I2FZC8_USTHO|nr:uncharacterized protein UHO2_03158 [Ustilago hordei]KAJ1045143.1 hypothetical protein NDA10_004343 [Ustilago hordei]KAJ1576817.1 hypothetical protein NDA15_000385 [Ustilago hordei]KAJ1578735.1 hypothetical protein NDA12_005797 [Ustilago hordei]KAJ1599201.1 hypothetical protein NDA14_004101 [Ustilago hordei]UTT91342.1 hypothetical protein NDA17_000298 [Ustilago hordei]
MSHHTGEGWSERNPIPTVQQYRQQQEELRAANAHDNTSRLAKSESDEAAPAFTLSVPATDGTGASTTTGAAPAIQGSLDGLRQRKGTSTTTDQASSADAPRPKKEDGVDSAPGGGAEEKERIKKAYAPKGKANEFEEQGERIVTDPTTGGEVEIRDASENAKIDSDKLDSRYGSGFSSNIPKDYSKLHPLNTSPDPAEPSNILLHRFPEPVSSDAVQRMHAAFNQLAMGLGGCLALIWFFFAFGNGWWKFLVRTSILAGVGFAGWTGLHLQSRKIEKEHDAIRAEMHKQRGQQLSPPMPESVEWLNAAIACVWKQINPDMFISVADMVEDIMQQSLPGFVDAVKIDDIGIGENPFRLVAMRGLADMMSDKEYPREEWITQGKQVPDTEAEKKQTEEKKKNKSEAEKALEVAEDADGNGVADEDESGDFLNFEVSFSYSARPGQSNKDRAKNIHLMVEFFIGAYDLFQIPLPIWIQIEHISGTVRLRCQMVQQAPYIRNLTFSLMGVPKVEISAIPMLKALPNVLDLPLISGFVQSSIAAAANMYVAPKSMTLNMAQMLSGDGIKKDTDAVGVLVVDIEYGEGLSAQDTNGKSDPYVVLSFAKFGRPLYSSRIIFEDLNPVWQETAFLLVTKDDIRANESLSIQLWDSDARTADDIVGRVNKPIKEFVRNANTPQDRKDKLMGFEDADDMPGTLKWKVAFYEKADFNKALVPKKKEEKMTKVEKETQREASAIDSEDEKTALHCPPDPQYPSGILSIIVHHISGLETRDVEKGVMGKEREGTYGQDVYAKAGEGKALPSGYVEFIVNDDIIYKTRVKQYTNMPFYEAGTETFIRDWTRTEVRLAVRDARLREHDPIMGIVSIDLTEVFSESSQMTQSFSLQDGVGFGKVHASLMFRSIKAQLPKPLLGWDTATVELLSEIQIEGDEKLKSEKIKVSTGDDTQKIYPGQRIPDDAETLVRLPVYDRYSSLLTFDLGGGGLAIGPLGGKPDAVAVAGLRDYADGEIYDLELDIMSGDNLGTLKRNYINEQAHKTHPFEVVGKLRVKIRIDAGLDDDHLRSVEQSTGRKDRHEFDVYNRLEGMPNRAVENAHANDDGVIDREEKKQMERSKKEALHSRHRGAMGYGGARTAAWAKDGVRDRIRRTKDKVLGKKGRDQTIKSEA